MCISLACSWKQDGVRPEGRRPCRATSQVLIISVITYAFPNNFPPLRWRTYAELEDALMNKKDLVIRACGHVEGGHLGENFIKRYIEHLMEFSLHCRLYPKTTTTHRLKNMLMPKYCL